jgi:hypothetical protein
VHAAQFACVAIMLAGLLGLFSALDDRDGAARLANRFGAAAAIAALALYGAVLAVDGVALKQAASAWIAAPEADKAARFASAEAVRWLEWGTRSYANFTMGLAVLCAAAVVAAARLPRPAAWLMVLSSAAYLAQGWFAGAQGFSRTHTIAIILAEVLNAVWMTWLLVAATRVQHSDEPRDAVTRRAPD